MGFNFSESACNDIGSRIVNCSGYINWNDKLKITKVGDEYSYIVIMFLIAIENIFPPIPSEMILTFEGFMTLFENCVFDLNSIFL